MKHSPVLSVGFPIDMQRTQSVANRHNYRPVASESALYCKGRATHTPRLRSSTFVWLVFAS